MRQLLTATLAVCCLVVCLSCGSDARSGDDASTARTDETSRLAQGNHAVIPAGGSDGDAEKAPRSVPGHLVVKFRDTLSEPADVIHRHGLRFAANARSGGADLDRLDARYRVSSITPVFSSLFARATAVPGKGALADRRRKVLESVNEAKSRFAARAARAGPRAEIPDLVRTYVLEVPADTDIEKMALDYAANPSVEYAVPDHVARTQALPDDPYLQSSGSWGQADGDLWALGTIGAPAAWDVATGVGVVVAVVDTGLDYNHPDIVGNVWANLAELNGVPGIDDDGNGYVDDVRGWDFAYGDADPMDGQGHGTHVSGTIAAVGNNGVGVIGVAFQARIMPVKGLDNGGYGSFSSLAAAVTYAARNGADVISNSWGCYGSGCTDAAVSDAVRLARSLGCVITFAAGNDDDDVKNAFPANLQDVITVAASGADDSKASFSNWGYLVDVAAPGGGPDAASPAAAYRNILSLRAAGTGDASLVVGGSYLRQAGTSMATPHVSGVAALLLSANPQLTVAQVESITRHTARDGVGDPSLDTAGYDPYYGWGRLDAAAAVARAFDPPADPPILKVVAGPLEFDVPASTCPGQQLSLPVGVYNLGGGTMSWSSVAPDWLSVQFTSATTPSFPSVSTNRLEDATGLLTIRSPDASNGPAVLPVVERVSPAVTIANCSTVLSKANSNQQWDPMRSWRPPAVPDGSGGAFHVWTDTRNNSPDLYMQRVDSNGDPLWTADGVPLTSALGAEGRATLIPDGSGGAIIAWVEGPNTSAISDQHIRAQRVNASGEKLWGVDGIWLCQSYGGQTNPTIVSDGRGGAVVAWQDYRSGSADIYAQRITPTGTALWQPNGVPVTRAPDAQFSPAIAPDASGGAIVTWVDRRTSYYAIYAQRVSGAGLAFWTQDGVLIAPQIATGPNIASDGAGGAIIAWHDFRNVPLNPGGATVLSRSDIFATRVNGLGQSVWPGGAVPVVSGLTVAPNAFVPGSGPSQVTMTPDARGGVFVVWHDSRNGSWDVYTQRLDAQGSVLWGTTGVPVTAAAGDQLSPEVVADGEDGAIYAWSDRRPGHGDVFVQHLGPTGVPLAAPNGVWVEGRPGDQSYPYVVPLAQGRFLVTWDDYFNCASSYCVDTAIDLVGKVVAFSTSPGFPLTVVRSGDGAGTVTSSPASIVCGASCWVQFPAGTSVTLTAEAAAGSVFSGWTGACTGAASTCTVAMDEARTVGASFSLVSYPLTVQTSGSGGGTVTGDGISCTSGSTAGCTASVPNTTPATSVTLTAAPAAGSVFSSWSGCTTVSGNVCTVSMTAAKTVTAAFQTTAWTLSVMAAGTGRGTVTGDGISCTTGSTVGCTASVPNTTPATSITLTAAPAAGSVFSSWSGCTTVSGNICTVSMTAARTVTATFQPAWLLTAKTSGTGRGTVTGEGIACTTGSTEGCAAWVSSTTPATSVTLTAAPEAGSSFSSWSGCTTVSGNVCTVSMTGARTVTATFQPSQYELTVKPVSLSGTTATGTIAGDVACGDPAGCTSLVPNGASVTLTAVPDASSLFKSWTGCSSMNGAACTVWMTAAKTVTATFMPSTYALTVKTAGTGAGGAVQGDGIDCSSTAGCTYVEPNGATVTLTAVPDATSLFKSWSGCTSTNGATCTVTMASVKTVTATFVPSTFALTVNAVASGGAGTVAGPGIACATGSTEGCTASVANGATVTLTATPDAGSILKTWSGCTSTNGATCTVTMASAKAVTATFQPSTYTLTVNAGTGGVGTVTGPGIACTTGSSEGCTASIANGATVTLTATPDATSLFKSWSGCTSMNGATCTVTMTSAKAVTATFQPTTYALAVNAVPSGGSGAVAGPGIACATGSTEGCTASVANGATVTLTATPDAGSILKSWSGCTSTNGATCTVAMTSAKSVTATFQPSTYTLTVNAGTGGVGTVTGPGIACTTGSSEGCTASIANGATVTLTATPDATSLFKSWNGCSSMNGATCTVTMTSAKAVTATFQPTTYPLTVRPASTYGATGTITGAGLECSDPAGCATTLANGSQVALTAIPAAGALLKSWTGCTSTNGATCGVTMTSAKTVTATFQPSTFRLTVTTAGTGTGTVTGPDIACTSGSSEGCAADESTGSVVTLTATPGACATFTSWSGACYGSASQCAVTMLVAKSVTATFAAGACPVSAATP